MNRRSPSPSSTSSSSSSSQYHHYNNDNRSLSSSVCSIVISILKRAKSPDMKLFGAFTMLLLLYTIVTVSVIVRVPVPSNMRLLRESSNTNTNSNGNDVDSTNIASAVVAMNAKLQQQNQQQQQQQQGSNKIAYNNNNNNRHQQFNKQVKNQVHEQIASMKQTMKQQTDKERQLQKERQKLLFEQQQKQLKKSQEHAEIVPEEQKQYRPKDIVFSKEQEELISALVAPSSATNTHITRLEDIHDLDTLQRSFPIHVDDNMEEIYHPGILLSNKAKIDAILRQHNLPDKMIVPKFWRPNITEYGPLGVRDFLGEHGKRLITPQEARAVGSWYYPEQDDLDNTPLETIYVSVAAYRDVECQPTVEDLYLRAKHPERIRVAVIDQRAENDRHCQQPKKPCEEDPEQVMCKYRHLIDVYEVEAKLSVGPVFARHLAHRMYRGEYFAMQVDSHVRFIKEWDDDLVNQWKSSHNEMAVMTTYLSDITNSINPKTYENTHPARPIMCKTQYEGNGKLKHLRHGQQPEGVPGIHGTPTIHPFWAAGFSFARGHFVVQVPYDQYQPMVFQGEEISIGLRGFTYGYDYYTAEKSVAFHIYANRAGKARQSQLKFFWENTSLYPGSNVEGMKRLNAIIGMPNDPQDGKEYYKVDEKAYGLGHVRRKEKFFKTFGIHTDIQKVEDNLCRFVGKPMQRMFIPKLRNDGMGIDYNKITLEFENPSPPAAAKKAKNGGK